LDFSASSDNVIESIFIADDSVSNLILKIIGVTDGDISCLNIIADNLTVSSYSLSLGSYLLAFDTLNDFGFISSPINLNINFISLMNVALLSSASCSIVLIYPMSFIYNFRVK